METQTQEKQSNPGEINGTAVALNEQKKQKSPLSKWLFWIFILAAVLVFYFMVIRPENYSKKASVAEPVIPESSITAENTVSMLNLQTKIIFPEIKVREPIDIDLLDRRFSVLNYPEASIQQANKVLYSDESVGYEITFMVQKTLNDFYFDISSRLKIAQWKEIFSTRAILAAIIETEKNNSKLKIIASKNNDGTTTAYVQAIDAQ